MLTATSAPGLRLYEYDPEADMVVTPFGLEPEAEGRPAGPAVVAPGAAPADPRIGSVPVRLAAPGRQVRVGAAGELRVVPVPAPLEGVAVHVVDSPCVRRVAADPGRLPRRRPLLAPVVGLAPEVRLPAAERVAERRGGGRPGPAGIFPLGLGRQAKLPALRQFARPAGRFAELPAECLRPGEVDVAHGELISLGQFRGRLARQRADDALPVALRDLVLPGPEAAGERYFDPGLVRPPLRLAGRAAHREPPRRAPAELDSSDRPLLAGPGAVRIVPEGAEAHECDERHGDRDLPHGHLTGRRDGAKPAPSIA